MKKITIKISVFSMINELLPIYYNNIVKKRHTVIR